MLESVPLDVCALVREPSTRMHLLHVGELAAAWAERLALAPGERETFVRSALLHDVGKLLVPEAIVVKPGPLDPGERAAMRRHVEYGQAILAVHDGFGEVAAVVAQHHERWDGQGYPRGTAGRRIAFLARAVSVVDAYSAMTLQRPYQAARSEAAALEELERHAGTQFDAALVASFTGLRRRAAGRREATANP